MEHISALRLTAEEEANLQLLRITDGVLIGVTNRDDLTGSLILPDTITEIGRKALSGCTGLTSITIPDSVTQIGYGAFFRCMSLTSITVHSNNPAYCSQKNILYTKMNTTYLNDDWVPVYENTKQDPTNHFILDDYEKLFTELKEIAIEKGLV